MRLKSQDGTEHPAHRIVLSAARSSFFEALFSGSFQEGEKIGSGEPVEIAASAGAVAGLLDYVYGGEATVATADAVELLRLADAYGMPELVSVVEAGLLASLDSNSALQYLTEWSRIMTSKLHTACEDCVAADFEQCVAKESFLKLPEWQLAIFLQRDDLNVEREETVLQEPVRMAACFR